MEDKKTGKEKPRYFRNVIKTIWSISLIFCYLPYVLTEIPLPALQHMFDLKTVEGSQNMTVLIRCAAVGFLFLAVAILVYTIFFIIMDSDSSDRKLKIISDTYDKRGIRWKRIVKFIIRICYFLLSALITIIGCLIGLFLLFLAVLSLYPD